MTGLSSRCLSCFLHVGQLHLKYSCLFKITYPHLVLNDTSTSIHLVSFIMKSQSFLYAIFRLILLKYDNGYSCMNAIKKFLCSSSVLSLLSLSARNCSLWSIAVLSIFICLYLSIYCLACKLHQKVLHMKAVSCPG